MPRGQEFGLFLLFLKYRDFGMAAHLRSTHRHPKRSAFAYADVELVLVN